MRRHDGRHRPLRGRRQLEVQRQHREHPEAGAGSQRGRDHRRRRGHLRPAHGVPAAGAIHLGPQVRALRAELLGRRGRRLHGRGRGGDARGQQHPLGHPRPLRTSRPHRRVRRVHRPEVRVRNLQGPLRDGLHRRDSGGARAGRYPQRVPQAAAGDRERHLARRLGEGRHRLRARVGHRDRQGCHAGGGAGDARGHSSLHGGGGVRIGGVRGEDSVRWLRQRG